MTTSITARTAASTLAPITQQLAQQRDQIESWFVQQWQQTPPPIYASVDVRDSGFKLAPVDTNLFPAGFNNLSAEDQLHASTAAYDIINQLIPGCQRILLMAENHSRNVYYLENLAHLQLILQAAGFSVKLGTLTGENHRVSSASGASLSLETPTRSANTIQLAGFVPDLILLNNDLAEGVPSLLTGISQTILPPMQLGWHQRLKSQHFQQYNQVCQRFASAIHLDPWVLNSLFNRCTAVDFMARTGENCLLVKTTQLLEAITQKYQSYHLTQKPYVVIKADAGTYGMGILTVETAEAIAQLSRKKRSHMMRTKGNRAIQQVILQEGVSSVTRWQETVAEPVIYLFGSKVIGGFYRTHATRNAQENLNTPGMQLHPFHFGKINQLTQYALIQNSNASQLYAYGVVARLAALAATGEV